MRRIGGGGGGGGEVSASLAALLCLCCLAALAFAAAAQTPRTSSSYKTLSGRAPLVVAQGGFSGLFPDSSQAAYAFALITSAADTSLTKDGVGICLPDINLQNCTTVPQAYSTRKRSYAINGVRKTGWFPVDFTLAELQAQSVALIQAIYSRTPKFDNVYPILSVTDLQSVIKPPSVWLNVQHDIFYQQHGLNMTKYILSIQKLVSVNYISSPELRFLQSVSGRVGRKTKLVFRFPDENIHDPSTNQTYGSLLRNLTFVRTIASGIMIPKSYILQVTSDNYLQPPTSIVTEAHNAGLEVYAADFANDRIIPYNYSYDPLEEYLSYISVFNFSVDGVLSDFPITASEAIGCFANLSTSTVEPGNPLVISHNGASGDYPDCTDLAYHYAIINGADIIDCPVQVTSDGVLICMSSINLLDTTNVQKTPFASHTSIITEIQSAPGIFTFNLTWAEINNSTLKPKTSSPFSNYNIVRNPRYINQGRFMTLSDFLAIGKDLPGVMIIIENAAFAAKSLGIDIVDSVTTALSNAGYDNQTTQEVLIQSKDSNVLVKLKEQKAKCKLVYTLPSGIGDASASSLKDMKEFADAVVVDKASIFALSDEFITNQTKLVNDLKSVGLVVYAQVFQNEFLSQPFDFLSDETVEINNFVQLTNISGIISDFPKTVRRYKANSCRGLGNDTPNYMSPIQVGSLVQLLQQIGTQPPALAPMPTLNASSVEEPPLPPVVSTVPAKPPGTSPSKVHTVTVSTSMLAVTVIAGLLI